MPKLNRELHAFEIALRMFDALLPTWQKDRLGYRTTSDSDHGCLYLAYASDPSEIPEAFSRAHGQEEHKTPVVVVKASARDLLESLRSMESPSGEAQLPKLPEGDEEPWILIRLRDLEAVEEWVVTTDPDELALMEARASAFCAKRPGANTPPGKDLPPIADAKREASLEE